VTVAPWVARGFGRLLPRSLLEAADRLGPRIAAWGLAPLAFGPIATPALMMTSGPFGWSLGLAPAIFRGFPDFLLHLDPDMALYFVFFLWGWWLHRQRAALPALGRTWLPSLLLGLVAFMASTALSYAYSRRFDAPGYALIRTGGSALYCLGSAWTAWGFLGVFIRYLDRPSRTWRYLADTALWVYLIHQPLVIVGLALFRPLHLAWWAQTAAVSALSAFAALLLHEAVVRPTPLVRLFGPASPRRAAAPSPDPSSAGHGAQYAAAERAVAGRQISLHPGFRPPRKRSPRLCPPSRRPTRVACEAGKNIRGQKNHRKNFRR
jgi:Acyltransferase family